MTHPDVLTEPLSLADFSATVANVADRGGRAIYTVKIRIRRDGDWVPAGILELYHEEWLRFFAVLNAHEAAHGNPVPKI